MIKWSFLEGLDSQDDDYNEKDDYKNDEEDKEDPEDNWHWVSEGSC